MLIQLTRVKNNRDLHQVILHVWSKFGGPNLNRWWVIAQKTQNGASFDFKGQGKSPQKQ